MKYVILLRSRNFTNATCFDAFFIAYGTEEARHLHRDHLFRVPLLIAAYISFSLLFITPRLVELCCAEQKQVNFFQSGKKMFLTVFVDLLLLPEHTNLLS